MNTTYTSHLGLQVWKGDWEGAEWTVTGVVKREHQVTPGTTFDSAYDFEDWVKKNIRCESVQFDSEYCQFFAYAKTKQRALGFLKAIEKKFEKLKKKVAELDNG